MAFFVTEECLICGTCWEICPTDSIVNHEWYYKVADTCVECGACRAVFPNAAIKRIKGNKKREAQAGKNS
jgi:ferredoxin